MPKFNVSALKIVSCTATVDAESEDAAIEMVKDNISLLDEQSSEYDYFEGEIIS